MLWFEYKYLTSTEIFNQVTHIINFGVSEILLLIILTIVSITLIFFVIPIFDIYVKLSNKQKEKNKRKETLRKIVLQKEINEDIEKEINTKKI